MPNQRVQYWSTVHLFIDTGRSPCKITIMPFIFINNSITILRGPIWLFIFAHSFVIVLSFAVVTFPPVKLRLNHALVRPQLVSEDTCSHVSLGKYCQIMFLRTFGSRRSPTVAPRNINLLMINSYCDMDEGFEPKVRKNTFLLLE
jgi:hypothetical protein